MATGNCSLIERILDTNKTWIRTEFHRATSSNRLLLKLLCNAWGQATLQIDLVGSPNHLGTLSKSIGIMNHCHQNLQSIGLGAKRIDLVMLATLRICGFVLTAMQTYGEDFMIPSFIPGCILNIFRNETVGTVFISMACHSFAPAGVLTPFKASRRLGVFCGQT